MVLEQSPVGITWTIDEPLARSAHALAEGGRVWLIDPVDEPAAVERVRSRWAGRPACCSCSTVTTATARRWPTGWECRTSRCRRRA